MTSAAEQTGPKPFGLRWPVKFSFISYVSRTPDGRAYLGDGAVVDAGNEFVFEFAEQAQPPDDADHAFTFRGDVRFTAHFGMLYVRLAEPRIVLRGDAGELIVLDPESDDGGLVRLVTFTVADPVTEDGGRRWEGTDVRLTAEGVPLFGDVYQAEEPFEPLTITVPEPGSTP